MLKKLFVFWSILLIALSGSSEGKILNYLSLNDRITTNKAILELRGHGENLSRVKVNGIPIDAKDDSFICGLILSPGKNLVKIEAWDKGGAYEADYKKILRLISFSDIDILYNKKPHWAKKQVVTLATLGIIEGYPDGNFYVNKSLTRGEMATWICRAKGFKAEPLVSDVFIDVPKEHWRAPFINEIVKRKYMRGAADNKYFGIDIPISRGEAAFIALAAEGPDFEKEIVSIFYDVSPANPFFEQIKLAKAKGLIRGISWKTAIYDPQRDITRAETPFLLARFNRIKKLGAWLYDFDKGFTSYCKINTPPKIVNLELSPQAFPVNAITPFKITLKVLDSEGLDNISYVKADLSQVGGHPDLLMRDVSGNGDYGMELVAQPISYGEKVITITATDKYGATGIKQIKALAVQ